MVHGSTRGMRLDSADPMATSGLQIKGTIPSPDCWTEMSDVILLNAPSMSLLIFGAYFQPNEAMVFVDFFVRRVLSMKMV